MFAFFFVCRAFVVIGFGRWVDEDGLRDGWRLRSVEEEEEEGESPGSG